MSLIQWFLRLISLKPHFVIGRPDSAYLLRWWLIPKNPWINVYLHKFLRDDDDRALHDHPWWFLSFMIWGRYKEYTPSKFMPALENVTPDVRSAPSIAYRPANHRHRVVLFRDSYGQPEPCWTIVITGPKSRDWGFWCKKGFVPWQEFAEPTNSGQVGKGCCDD